MSKKTIVTLAAEMDAAFTTGTRQGTGEPYSYLEDGRPDWMQDVMFSVHGSGEYLPDDTIYEMTRDCLSAISECDEDDDEDTIRERISEIESEYRTGKLFTWATQFGEWIDEYLNSFGAFTVESSGDLDTLFMGAQHLQIESIGDELIKLLSDLADEDEDESTAS